MKTIIVSFDFMTYSPIPLPTNSLSFLATCVIILIPLFFPLPPLVFVLIILTHLTSFRSLANCDTDRLTCNRGFIWFIPMSSDQITSKNCSPAMSPNWACAHSWVSSSPEAQGSWVSCSAISYHCCKTSVSSGPVALHDGTNNQHWWGTICGLSGCRLL